MSTTVDAGAFRWTEAEVVRALGLWQSSCEDRAFRRISTDSRTLAAGDLFVALRGARFDGHDFLERAVGAGAAGAVVQRLPVGAPESLRYFVVRDTRDALRRLARHRRLHLPARVVGVVGSNGKTTK